MPDAPARRPRPAGAPRSRRLRTGAVLAVLLVLLGAVVVRLATRSRPPVVGADAPVLLEPYRYVVRPIGVEPSSAGPPTTATTRVPVRSGLTAAGLTLSTTEARPQAVLFLPLQGLRTAGRSLGVVLEPLAPAPLPAGRSADGNRYRVRTDAPVGLAQQGAFATLQLRTATGRGDLVVLVRSGATWRPLPTTPGPGGVYGAPFVGPGDYQLAAVPTARPATTGSRTLPVVVGLALLALLLTVVGLRVSARRRGLLPG